MMDLPEVLTRGSIVGVGYPAAPVTALPEMSCFPTGVVGCAPRITATARPVQLGHVPEVWLPAVALAMAVRPMFWLTFIMPSMSAHVGTGPPAAGTGGVVVIPSR